MPMMETISVTSILLTVIAAAITLGMMIRGLRSDMNVAIGELRHDVGEIRERMARLEELFEGFAGSIQQNSPPERLAFLSLTS